MTPSPIIGIRAVEDLDGHGVQSLIISNSRQGIIIIIYICIILTKHLHNHYLIWSSQQFNEISRKDIIKILISQKRKLKELEILMATEDKSRK